MAHNEVIIHSLFRRPPSPRRAPGWRTAFTALLLAWGALRAVAVPTPPSAALPPALLPALTATGQAGTPADAGPGAPAWRTQVGPALAQAAEQYRPVLLLFTSPNCPWCMRLKNEVLPDPEITALLRYFIPVDVNIELDRGTALQYGVRGVPSLVVLASDGRVLFSVSGFQEKPVLLSLLRRSLNPNLAKTAAAAWRRQLDQLEDGTLPADKWPELFAEAVAADARGQLSELVLKRNPLPRRELTALLTDPQLAVRLCALEILERATGESFGFDAWAAPAAGDANREALAKWRRWAGESESAGGSVYSSLTREQVLAAIRDLLGDDKPRALRAALTLERGGQAAAEELRRFQEANPQLPAGAVRQLRQCRYGILLAPAALAVPPATLAQRLLFGTLEVRLAALQQLGKAGPEAVPVLADFLADDAPIVRETAAEALIAAGGRHAAGPLARLLAAETDADVLTAVLRRIGKIENKGPLGMLVPPFLSHANEDVVVAATGALDRKDTGNALLEQLGKCLEDPRWRVRAATLDAVGKIRSPKLLPQVLDKCGDPDLFVRRHALETAVLLGEKNRKVRDRLAALFRTDDELKGDVLRGLIAMDANIPDTFAAELAGKNAEVLLAVLEPLEKHRQPACVQLAAGLTGNPDRDVACTALRTVARNGMEKPEWRRLVVNVLRGKDPTLAQAALEGLVHATESLKTENPADVAATPKGNAASQEIADLFASIDAPAGKKDAAPAPGAPAAVTPKPEMTAADLLADFDRPEAATVAELAAAVKNWTCEPGRPPNFTACIVSIGFGDGTVVPHLLSLLPTLTAGERYKITRALNALAWNDAKPLLQRLLGDGDQDTRTGALEALLRHHKKTPAAAGAVLDELRRAGTPLKAEEALMALAAATDTAARPFRTEFGTRCRQLLDAPETDLVSRNFALAALLVCWVPGDEKRVEPLTRAPEPTVRRNAWYLLGMRKPDLLVAAAPAVAADPDERVRAVIPNVYSRNEYKWVIYLDDARMTEESLFRNSKSRFAELPDGVAEALRKLAADPSPKVRIEALFCQLENRIPANPADLLAALENLPDTAAAATRAAEFLNDQSQRLDRKYAVLAEFVLKHAAETGNEDVLSNSTLKRFGLAAAADEEDEESGEKDEAAATRAELLKPAPHAGGPAPAAGVASGTQPAPERIRLVFFRKTGCRDCAQVERWLEKARAARPGLAVEEYDIAQVSAMRYNEALAGRFRIPQAQRLVAPAVFAAAGGLVRGAITEERLARLLDRSAGQPESWAAMPEESLVAADTAITSRYTAFGAGVVSLAGLVDGVNPCAFATIIFLLSYLQVTGRRPRDVAQVGVAFVAGVFLAYYFLGMGLVEAVSRLAILRRAGEVLNVILAMFTLLILVLSVRDGILCLRGRMMEMSLQLPDFLKRGIHAVIRRGARQRHVVPAAFAAGIVVSVLELACTGQVYAPTILFMLKTGQNVSGALGYLLLYNLAFILPLLVVFGISLFLGTRHGRFTQWLQQHAAGVKFATAALFLILFLFFVFGNRLHLS